MNESRYEIGTKVYIYLNPEKYKHIGIKYRYYTNGTIVGYSPSEDQNYSDEYAILFDQPIDELPGCIDDKFNQIVAPKFGLWVCAEDIEPRILNYEIVYGKKSIKVKIKTESLTINEKLKIDNKIKDFLNGLTI